MTIQVKNKWNAAKVSPLTKFRSSFLTKCFKSILKSTTISHHTWFTFCQAKINKCYDHWIIDWITYSPILFVCWFVCLILCFLACLLAFVLLPCIFPRPMSRNSLADKWDATKIYREGQGLNQSSPPSSHTLPNIYPHQPGTRAHQPTHPVYLDTL